MRIISGIYRGRILKSPADNKTRPTSDRLRETLFNILKPRIDEETRFLDLCAGTGAIGIEALSRGALFTTFVDKSKRSCALIEENLDLLKIPEEETEIINLSAENFTSREQSNGWDIVYFDPPYDSEYIFVLRDFGENDKLLNQNGIFIAEHHSKTELPDEVFSLRRWRILKQGETCLSFYEKN
ncbi:MAG TPA: 16S rRNA (guanine(966)-N(2))-methyltransferase RsmD [Pyrinomonadaceae bacterium]|nr:16S rRNA (guanine(966)-N(2))-methyltransferase RsmD [Pyrinomonadaceae bacterium]